MSNINTKDHWENRFKTDWDNLGGDKQSEFFASIAKKLLPAWLKKEIISNNLSVLDWGCAEGDGTNRLSETIFPNIEGMDFSLAAVNNAKERYKNINFYCEDLLAKNNFNKKYDIFFASNVFEHFEEPWEIFDKVKHVAKKYIILLVPYNEGFDNLIDEHYFSFDSSNIPLKIDNWTLCSFSLIDTGVLPNTYWSGKQSLIIYAKQEVSNKVFLSDFINYELSIKGYETRLEEKNVLIQKKQYEYDEVTTKYNNLKNRLADVEKYNLELNEVLNSKRIKIANKIANMLNAVIPSGSIRRKIAYNIYRIIAKLNPYAIKKGFSKRKMKIKIQKNSQITNSAVIYTTMPWNHHLKQRPHHLMKELSKAGVYSVYVDETIEDPIMISKNMVILSKKDWQYYINPLAKKDINLYYMTAAHYPITFDELKEIEDNGYELIYEYIDDLDEAIFGNLDKQLEVFSRLKELKPVLIIASAKRLYNQMIEIFPKEKVLLNENAVDITHFKPIKRVASNAPKDINHLVKSGKPIVGYYGAIAPWLDYSLIGRMADSLPNYEFVFIGPDYHGGLDSMPKKSNIHLLGPKNYTDLPSYSNWFDCAIIPFQEGDIAKATSPVKLFEYMAMALPTVCTKDLQECAGYEGVLMSKDKEDFIHNLEKAVSLKNNKKISAKLLGYAKDNTWAARAHDIANKIDVINKEK